MRQVQLVLKVILIIFLYRQVILINSKSTELVERCRINVSLFLKNIIMIVNE